MYTEKSIAAQSYMFEVSSLVNSIKSIEIEMDVVELFYNLHFYPFNVDAWFSRRLSKIIHPQIFCEFTRAGNIVEKFPGKTIGKMNLRTIQMLRDIILDSCINDNQRIEIRSTHLNESYTCVLEKTKLKVFNVIHNDNYISLGSDIFVLEDNINKHILFQFVLNPFWDNKVFSYECNQTDMLYDEECGVIVRNNDNSLVTIEGSPELSFMIDNHNNNWNEPFVKNVLNVYLREREVNITHLERCFLSVVLCSMVDEAVKNGIWCHYRNMTDAIYDSSKSNEKNYLFSHDEMYVDSCNKCSYDKILVWGQFAPVYNETFLQKNIFEKYKNHTFYDLDQDIISKLKNFKLCCNDIYIISQLLCINPEMVNILPYFLRDSPELPMDSLRTRIIKAYFENEYNGKKHLSAYGLDYLMRSTYVKKSQKFYQTNIIFSDELFKISLCIEKISGLTLFDLLEDSGINFFPNSKMSKLINEKTTTISKALTLFVAYKKNLTTWNHSLSLFIDTFPESISFFMENRAEIIDYPTLRVGNSVESLQRDEEYLDITIHDIVSQYLTQHKILRNSNTRSYHQYRFERIGFQKFVKNYISRATYTLSGTLLKVSEIEWSGSKKDMYDILLRGHCPLMFGFNIKIQFPEYTYIYEDDKIFLKKNIKEKELEMLIDVKNIQVDLLVWILSIKY